jgi:putative beta barrel porin BBP7
MSSRSWGALLTLAVCAIGEPTIARAQIPGSVVAFRQPPTTIAPQSSQSSGPALATPGDEAEQAQPRPIGARPAARGRESVRTVGMQTPVAQPDPISTGTPGGAEGSWDQGYGQQMMDNSDDYGDGPVGPGYGSGGYGAGNTWTIGRPCDNGWGCNWIGCQTGYGPRNSIYAQAEYLGWWVKGDSLPPLVTTSALASSAGVLGQPGTSVLFGGDAVNGGMRSGVRTALGYYVDLKTRIEGDFFWLGTENASFNESSGGTPILARPFFNLSPLTPNAPPNPPRQDSNVIASPGLSTGSIQVNESSSFLGAGISAIRNLCCMNYCCDGQYKLDLIYGFRYLRLAENLTINDSLTSVGGTVAPIGTVISKFDGFKTANNFYGFNVGLSSERRSARWSWTTIGRIALGATAQHTTIAGNTNTTQPGQATTTTSGGLLALPSNIGSYNRGAFGFVPQLELKLGYYLTPNLRLTVGYDILYWSQVLRPGAQVNTAINTTQLPPGPQFGPAAPIYAFHEQGLWVQGISLGGDLRF